MGLARVGRLERALARGARRLRHHDVVVRRATRRAACMLAGAPASPARWWHLAERGVRYVTSSACTWASRFEASAVSKTTHVTLFKPRTRRCPSPRRDLKCAFGNSQRLARAR